MLTEEDQTSRDNTKQNIQLWKYHRFILELCLLQAQKCCTRHKSSNSSKRSVGISQFWHVAVTWRAIRVNKNSRHSAIYPSTRIPNGRPLPPPPSPESGVWIWVRSKPSLTFKLAYACFLRTM